MKNLPYNTKLKENSRNLRLNSTLSEVLLWKYLRAKQMKGYAFNRQKPILNYIVDFYSKDLNLVIEIDGDSHNHKYLYDIQRQKEIESLNLCFLRFDDIEIKKDINNVILVIENWIENFENEK